MIALHCPFCGLGAVLEECDCCLIDRGEAVRELVYLRAMRASLLFAFPDGLLPLGASTRRLRVDRKAPWRS